MIPREVWFEVYNAVKARFTPTPKDVPETFIQWKGTDVCLDFHCPCGHHSHWDRDFLYSLRCPKCRKIFRLATFIEVVEITQEESDVLGCLQETELEEG